MSPTAPDPYCFTLAQGARREPATSDPGGSVTGTAKAAGSDADDLEVVL
jgi:hypothetical protein